MKMCFNTACLSVFLYMCVCVCAYACSCVRASVYSSLVPKLVTRFHRSPSLPGAKDQDRSQNYRNLNFLKNGSNDFNYIQKL
jgi:hypothetical protein